jgi:peptidoglycan hydrolase CwlO-like protein
MESLTEATADLALELRESMPSTIFSRATLTGKIASKIRAQLDDIITTLVNDIESYQEKINSLTKLANNMKSDLKAKDSDIKDLKCEKKPIC